MCHPRYPGPVVLAPDERIPYAFIARELSEIGREEVGLVLWQVLRDVRAWLEAISAPDEPTLGDAGWKLDGLVPELAATLPALDRLVRDTAPDRASVEAVAVGCMHVGLWAEDAAAGRTALAFFQAAEDVDPDNPHYAYSIGRVARKLALYDEAEAWLKWAHWVARGAGRWEVATLAMSGLGNLHRQRGNLPLAMRYHELTRRIARRHDLRTLEGDALYDLAGLCLDGGDLAKGMEFARRAISTYGPGHGRIFGLAKDIAWFLMDCHGDFDNAVHVFSTLLEHVWEPERRVMLLASLARAAAGAGWIERFESAWVETWALLRRQPMRSGHAGALIQLAYGAGYLESWNRAHLAAREALSTAEERREGEMVLAAESILSAVQNGFIAENTLEKVFRDHRRTAAHLPQPDATELVCELTEAMRARRDGAPQGPIRSLMATWPG
jgi:tetratricopeptide (TPR) repeat protein